MCRIYGVLTSQRSEHQVSQLLDDFNLQLQHGGPDGEGKFLVFDGQQIGLGHRRLSIIDLSDHGKQPMSDIHDQAVITFNGEIYNYNELRAQLEQLGYDFRSQTDTEVIINAFLAWGIDAFDKLEGIFAFGLFDRRNHCFYLVRDRFGVKPVYYSYKGEELIFTSEITPLYSLGFSEENPNWKPLFLTFGHLPEPITTLKNVFELPKGKFLSFNTINKDFRISPYVKINKEPLIFDKRIAQNRIRESLEASVRKQLVSDVPVAVFLSGGIDSSLIALIVSKNQSDNISTVSLDFKESGFSERNFQDIITKQSGLFNHRIVLGKESFLNDLTDIVDSYDQPSVDGINTWMISKFTRSIGAKVAISGIGADELFGGYPSFTNINLLNRIDRIPRFLFNSFRYLPEGRLKRVQFGGLRDELGRYLMFRGNFSLDTVASILDTSTEYVTNILSDFYVNKETKELQGHGLIQWLESNLYMQNQLLKDTDYMSMRHGLEVRIPFLDRDLVNTVLSIDNTLWRDQQFVKELLVESFPNVLPSAIWKRRKQGFGLPFNGWMQNERILGGLLTHPNSKIRTVAKLFKEGKIEWPRLWSLYQLENFEKSKLKK